MAHAQSYLCLLIFLIPGTVPAEDKLPPREQFHLYLLIGQSNMAGRGRMASEQQAPDRVLKLDKNNQWAPATDPLHFDKPRIAGVGPGSGFGPAMANAQPGVTIGLIPCAVGGTPLRRWQKGGDLYRRAVQRTKIAMKSGTLKGILWHQGESDAGKEETAKTYSKRLIQMIKDLRAELGQEKVPFVVGKLAPWVKPPRMPFKSVVEKALEDLPKQVPAAKCVEATGLKGKDAVHFDAKSARELGRRYAKAMLELLKEKPQQ